jgi:hypothetical protein
VRVKGLESVAELVHVLSRDGEFVSPEPVIVELTRSETVGETVIVCAADAFAVKLRDAVAAIVSVCIDMEMVLDGRREGETDADRLKRWRDTEA